MYFSASNEKKKNHGHQKLKEDYTCTMKTKENKDLDMEGFSSHHALFTKMTLNNLGPTKTTLRIQCFLCDQKKNHKTDIGTETTQNFLICMPLLRFAVLKVICRYSTLVAETSSQDLLVLQHWKRRRPWGGDE